jgi:hypothetical protein
MFQKGRDGRVIVLQFQGGDIYEETVSIMKKVDYNEQSSLMMPIETDCFP